MRQFWVIVGIVILGVVGMNFVYVCRLTQVDYETKLQDLAKIRQSIYESEYTNRLLRARVAHLKTDQGLEEVAREKLGYVFADETSYVVVPTQPLPKPEPATFPVNTQPRDDNTLFFAFVHAAFGPPEIPPAPVKKAPAKS